MPTLQKLEESQRKLQVKQQVIREATQHNIVELNTAALLKYSGKLGWHHYSQVTQNRMEIYGDTMFRDEIIPVIREAVESNFPKVNISGVSWQGQSTYQFHIDFLAMSAEEVIAIMEQLPKVIKL